MWIILLGWAHLTQIQLEVHVTYKYTNVDTKLQTFLKVTSMPHVATFDWKYQHKGEDTSTKGEKVMLGMGNHYVNCVYF